MYQTQPAEKQAWGVKFDFFFFCNRSQMHDNQPDGQIKSLHSWDAATKIWLYKHSGSSINQQKVGRELFHTN